MKRHFREPTLGELAAVLDTNEEQISQAACRQCAAGFSHGRRKETAVSSILYRTVRMNSFATGCLCRRRLKIAGARPAADLASVLCRKDTKPDSGGAQHDAGAGVKTGRKKFWRFSERAFPQNNLRGGA